MGSVEIYRNRSTGKGLNRFMPPKKEKIFNDRERKVFRKVIPPQEVTFSVFFILLTAGMAWWFFAQEDNYDPGERDIAIELLQEQSVEDNLYRTPLKRWVDPALVPAGGEGLPLAVPDMGIFPPEILATGWQPEGRVEEFGYDNVYEKIDGQETQYKAFGFQYLHFITLERPNEELYINIELYDQTNFTNALGLFAAQRTPGAVVQKAGNTYFTPTSVGALGMVGKYYFKLTGNEESPLIEEQTLQFIEAFGAGVADAGEPPALLAALESKLNFDQIAYEKQDVFQYEFASDFWFGRPGTPDGPRIFVHEAADDAAAAELYSLFLEEQKYEYTVLNEEAASALLKHEFLDTVFGLVQDGRYVYGVDNAADEASAKDMLNLAGEVIAVAAGGPPATPAPIGDESSSAPSAGEAVSINDTLAEGDGEPLEK